MKIKKVLRNALILILLSSNIACDQISKNIVRQRIETNKQTSLVGKYLTLTRVENTGAFLSLGENMSRKTKLVLLTILPLIVLGLVILFLLTKKTLSVVQTVGSCFIIGGGIGNLFDRLIYGSVTDFLHIDLVIFHTGIFNMADVSVMTGMFILFLSVYNKQTKPDLSASH